MASGVGKIVEPYTSEDFGHLTSILTAAGAVKSVGRYAEGASGTVIYVHPDGYYCDVWKNIERPILEFKGVHIIEEVL